MRTHKPKWLREGGAGGERGSPVQSERSGAGLGGAWAGPATGLRPADFRAGTPPWSAVSCRSALREPSGLRVSSCGPAGARARWRWGPGASRQRAALREPGRPGLGRGSCLRGRASPPLCLGATRLVRTRRPPGKVRGGLPGAGPHRCLSQAAAGRRL